VQSILYLKGMHNENFELTTHKTLLDRGENRIN